MRCKNPDLVSSRTIGLSFKDTICSRDLVLEECRKLGMKLEINRSRRETKKSEEGIRFHSRYNGKDSSSGCYSAGILRQRPAECKTGNNGSGRKTEHPDIIRNILHEYEADFEQHFIEETFETPLGIIAQPDHVFARGNEALVAELKRFEKKNNIHDIMQTKPPCLP